MRLEYLKKIDIMDNNLLIFFFINSRSHVIITVKLTQNENGVKKVSQVNLVDLAGSEWNKKVVQIFKLKLFN